MGSSRYKMAQRALSSNHGKTLHVSKLRSIIAKELGSDEKTINKYLKMMGTYGLIKEVEHLQFSINSQEVQDGS